METVAALPNLGDVVALRGRSTRGVVRFCGKTRFGGGLWVGLELDSDCGKNDGSVQGVEYFKCIPGRGLFTRPEGIEPVPAPRSARGAPATSPTASGPARRRSSSGVRSAAQRSRRSRMAASPQSPVQTPTFGETSASGPKCFPQAPTAAVTAAVSVAPAEADETYALGDRIWFGSYEGVVRFQGRTEFADGDWVGVELNAPVGKNDGSIGGVRYFSCPALHGLFCRRHQVRHLAMTLEAREMPASPPAASARLSAGRSCDSGSRSQVSRLRRSSSGGGKGSPTSPSYRLGDRYRVGRHEGLLRFHGPTEFAEGQWLGLELSSPIGKNDGSVNGVRYFTCKPLHGLFCQAHQARAAFPSSFGASSPRAASLGSRTSRTSGSLPPGGRLRQSKIFQDVSAFLADEAGEPIQVAPDGRSARDGRQQRAKKAPGRSDAGGAGRLDATDEVECCSFGSSRAGPGGAVKWERDEFCTGDSSLFMECWSSSAGSTAAEGEVLRSKQMLFVSEGASPDTVAPAYLRLLYERTALAEESLQAPLGTPKVGGRVRVGNCDGVVRFRGRTAFAEGEWLGLELDSATGKNDGSVNGVRYFSCAPLHGLFCRASQVRRTTVSSLSSRTKASGSGPTSPCSSPTSLHGAAHLYLCALYARVAAEGAEGGSSEVAGLVVGRRIRWGQHDGVLRFRGRTQFADGTWIGVELDSPLGKNDGSVNGVRYFACKPLHGLFCRSQQVRLVGASPRSDRQQQSAAPAPLPAPAPAPAPRPAPTTTSRSDAPLRQRVPLEGAAAKPTQGASCRSATPPAAAPVRADVLPASYRAAAPTAAAPMRPDTLPAKLATGAPKVDGDGNLAHVKNLVSPLSACRNVHATEVVEATRQVPTPARQYVSTLYGRLGVMAPLQTAPTQHRGQVRAYLATLYERLPPSESRGQRCTKCVRWQSDVEAGSRDSGVRDLAHRYLLTVYASKSPAATTAAAGASTAKDQVRRYLSSIYARQTRN